MGYDAFTADDGFRTFQTYCLHFQGLSMSMKMQALCTFKMARTTHLRTQCCSPENLNPHKQCNQNSNLTRPDQIFTSYLVRLCFPHILE